MPIDQREVILDVSELMILETVLAPSEVSAADSSGLMPASMPSRELCLKVGSALIEAVEEKRVVPLALSEAECWAIRERVSIFASVGSRADAGLSVKLKLYHLLLDFKFEKEVGELTVVDYEEKPTTAARTSRILRGKSHGIQKNELPDAG